MLLFEPGTSLKVSNDEVRDPDPAVDLVEIVAKLPLWKVFASVPDAGMVLAVKRFPVDMVGEVR